jgi:hypothetical protein
VAWRVEILDETVAAEIADLPADIQARFLRLAERIIKTSRRTPRAEIELALRRAKEIA